MTFKELIEQLDNRYGNPLGPVQYDLIRTAIAMLKEQANV